MAKEITESVKTAWLHLLTKLSNPYSASAVLGFFYTQTSLDPLYGLLDHDSKQEIELQMKDFVRNGKAFGIGAWSYWSDKQSLWNLSKATGTPLNTLELQIDFFIDQLNGLTYKELYEALKGSKTVYEALMHMEELYSPSINTEHMSRDLEARVNAMYYYDHLARPVRAIKYAKVMDDKVPVRKRCSRFSLKLGYANLGDMYPYIVTSSKNPNWYGIVYGDRIGWIPAWNTQIVERDEVVG